MVYTKEEFKARVSMAYEGREQWEAFLNMVWSIHTSELPHWINAKAKKPKLKHSEDNMKYSDTVIVTNGQYCTSARWLYSTWGGWYGWYDDSDEELKGITHWMPMPAPPKKGGND